MKIKSERCDCDGALFFLSYGKANTAEAKQHHDPSRWLGDCAYRETSAVTRKKYRTAIETADDIFSG
jgi:hypothetical protein